MPENTDNTAVEDFDSWHRRKMQRYGHLIPDAARTDLSELSRHHRLQIERSVRCLQDVPATERADAQHALRLTVEAAHNAIGAAVERATLATPSGIGR
jgi:hypothetical protein